MHTIKEVSEKMEISEHTLRFWAKNDLFPFVSRDKNNFRIFSNEDLEWVRLVKCLRGVGVENKLIKKYIDLCLEGDSTVQERYGIIKTTRKKAQEQMQELKTQIELLDYKENYYKKLLKTDQIDSWNPANNIKLKINA